MRLSSRHFHYWYFHWCRKPLSLFVVFPLFFISQAGIDDIVRFSLYWLSLFSLLSSIFAAFQVRDITFQAYFHQPPPPPFSLRFRRCAEASMLTRAFHCRSAAGAGFLPFFISFVADWCRYRFSFSSISSPSHWLFRYFFIFFWFLFFDYLKITTLLMLFISPLIFSTTFRFSRGGRFSTFSDKDAGATSFHFSFFHFSSHFFHFDIFFAFI